MKTLKRFGFILFLSFITSLVALIIYIKIPPFYIYSLNYSVVPYVEKIETQYTYNNYYQGEYSKNLVSSLALFAATSDFKLTLSKNTLQNFVYVMSKTNGSNLVNIKLVSFNKLNTAKINSEVYKTLNTALQKFVSSDIKYSLNNMDEFNHVYTGALSNTKFFTLVFSISAILFSGLYLLVKNKNE